ncbi:MAG: hypothetical protein WC875_05765 [Candidatus Absconditabacterales bacterium]|jgi:hypothetical protein
MEERKKLQTLEGVKTFIKDISEWCRKNLLVALNDVENLKRYRIVVTERFVGRYVEELGCNANRESK